MARLDERVIHHVEELHWQAVLHVNDCVLVQKVVEVDFLVQTVAPQNDIFTVDSLVNVCLVETVLLVKLQVPGDEEHLSVTVLYEQDLHQILHARCVDVFDPD